MNIRKITLNDTETLAKIHVDTWHTAYSGIIPSAYLNNLSYLKSKNMFEDLVKRQLNDHLLIEYGNEVVGFVSFGNERTGTYPYKGEIQALYVKKQYQGKGLGKQLFLAARHGLKERGIDTLMLWVLAKNESIKFYKHLGGKVIDQKDVQFDSTVLREIALGWNSI